MSPAVLPSRPLGKNGPVLPRLGLGFMNNSGAYNAVDSDEARLAFLDKAYEMDETFWDSADMYGDSEELLGKWFQANPDKRKDIFLATKFAIDMSNMPELRVDSSPEYCRAACARSLARLGTDYIDLYYVHRLDGKTPIEHTMEALVALKEAGKIRHIGLSACSAASLRRACAVHPVAAVQTEYSLAHRVIETPERTLLDTARELGVAIVAYSPLGRGLLTGTIRSAADMGSESDIRQKYGMPRFTADNLEKNAAIVAQIADLATKKGASASQLCLAWVLAQGDDIFAIPGTRKVARLAENLGSLDVVATITPSEEKTLRALGAQVVGASSRPEHAALDFGNTPEL